MQTIIFLIILYACFIPKNGFTPKKGFIPPKKEHSQLGFEVILSVPQKTKKIGNSRTEISIPCGKIPNFSDFYFVPE